MSQNQQMLSGDMIAQLVTLGRRAGEAIMAIYRARDSYQVSHKTDTSPLTAADLAAHQLICQQLRTILDVPVISEEGTIPSFVERQSWKCYWLVDPLDGTKEFIAGNGEFTVNIALVSGGHPVLGLVHVPVSDISYLGVLQARDPDWVGAWKFHGGGEPEAISCSSLGARQLQGEPLRLLLSHRHGTQATQQLVTHLEQHWPGGVTQMSAGSSLKFCLIAEGAADCYPRMAPTCEWDTGAAQALLEAAGGRVVQVPEELQGDGLEDLSYNLSDDLINPYFLALGDRNFAWPRLLKGSGRFL